LLDEEEDDLELVVELSDGVFGVQLPADIRIQKIVSLKPDLVVTLGASKVKYDASRVALADTASIQVVAAHLAALDAGDTDVEWIGASEDFLDTAKILGFDFCPSEPAENVDEAVAA
jgi:ABC-type Fe3+-hydroxamate transport system substrate-binding protein